MGGDQGFHIVDLAIGGRPAVIRNSIPTRETLLCCSDGHGDGMPRERLARGFHAMVLAPAGDGEETSAEQRERQTGSPDSHFFSCSGSKPAKCIFFLTSVAAHLIYESHCDL